MPRGPETQVYSIEQSDLGLVGTAEILWGDLLRPYLRRDNYHSSCVVLVVLPYRGGCSRSGVSRFVSGAQFTKIEMFAYSLPDQSEGVLEDFCQIECDLFDGLGIPYRVVDTATGDLGGPAYRKYDLEAWILPRRRVNMAKSRALRIVPTIRPGD